MRCERCHGTQIVNGMPCMNCFGGEVNCCDGEQCNVPGYKDESYSERNCDYCGLLYKGPAVYCSLACATADA